MGPTAQPRLESKGKFYWFRVCVGHKQVAQGFQELVPGSSVEGAVGHHSALVEPQEGRR